MSENPYKHVPNKIWNSIPKDHQGSIKWGNKHQFGHNKSLNTVCWQPFKGGSIDRLGNVYICTCDGYLPVSVGHILDFDNIEDIWNNPLALELQGTILDKTYLYCDVSNCGIKQTEKVNKEKALEFHEHYDLFVNIDESCNLRCPSCRDDLIFIKRDNVQFAKKIQMIDHLEKLIKKFDGQISLTTSGNGDPFASEIYQNFLKNINLKPGQIINFLTNGLLLKTRCEANPNLIETTQNFFISVDAATKNTYEKVRPPAKWERLIENLDYLAEKRFQPDNPSNPKFLVTIMFVISSLNFRDIPDLFNLCKKYNFKYKFSYLQDWYTQEGAHFKKYAVHKSTHPDFREWQIMYQKYIREIDAGLSFSESSVN